MLYCYGERQSHCRSWNSCGANVQRGGCTFDDIFTQVVQYSRWSQFYSFDVKRQRYKEVVNSLRHLCNNIEPGTNTIDAELI